MKRVDEIIHVFAGFVVLTTSLLGYSHHRYWLFLTMLVGLNLFQYGFTDFCPLAIVLKKLGVKE